MSIIQKIKQWWD